MRITIPYINTTIKQDLLTTLYLAPLWWLLGFNIFIFHVVSIWMFLKLVVQYTKTGERVRIPGSIRFLILLILTYSISIVFNFGSNEVIRSVASIYNLSYWVMGVFLVIVIYNVTDIETISSISKAFRVNMYFIGILAILGAFVWLITGNEIVFSAPVRYLLPNALDGMQLLSHSTTVTIVTPGWVSQTLLPRAKIMSPSFPSAAGVIAMLLPLAAVLYYKASDKRIYILISLALIAILLTFARSPLVAILVAVSIVYLLNKKHRWGYAFFSISMLLLFLPVIIDFMLYVNDLRAGSTHARFNIYGHAFSFVFSENPFIGIGVKPRDDSLSALPIGSHSTYLGMLLKSGLIGLFFMVAFQVELFLRWLSSLRKSLPRDLLMLHNALGISLISAGMFLLTQDLDSPQFFAFLYFSIVGMMSVVTRAARREVKDEDESE